MASLTFPISSSEESLLSSTKGNSTFFGPSPSPGYLIKERQILKLELPRTGSFVTF
jgi:hypothetical protein